MRWTNSWGRGLNRSAGRALGHCVLRWGQDVPSFPHDPFLAPAIFLRCASDSFSLTPNTLAQSSCQRRYALRLFGFIPECRSASLRKQRSASPESSREYKLWGRLEGAALYGSSKAFRFCRPFGDAYYP